MFATCLFCNGPLGKNETIEHFPVGRRLAFDQSRGRLWVVCPKCERWNLSPLEERWEAIEEAERAFHDAKKRVATDNIGLARVADGVDLVRIGSPLLPEFAAWRYGDQFGRRRMKAIGYSALAIGATTGIIWAGPLGAGIVAGGGSAIINAFSWANIARERFWPVTSVRDPAGNALHLSRKDVRAAKIQAYGSGNELRLQFTHRRWRPPSAMLTRLGVKRVPLAEGLEIELTGDDVTRALANLLPITNSGGGSKQHVRDAVKLVENNTAQERLLANTRTVPTYIAKLNNPLRLALEMSLHEADERRALEGGLRELEQRWRDAEEIAAIADSLMLPAETNSEFERIKARSDDEKLR